MYEIIGNSVYYVAENAIGFVTPCGEVCIGFDGLYIEWYV